MKTFKIMLILVALAVQGFSQVHELTYVLNGTLPGYKKNYIYLRKGPVITILCAFYVFNFHTLDLLF